MQEKALLIELASMRLTTLIYNKIIIYFNIFLKIKGTDVMIFNIATLQSGGSV